MRAKRRRATHCILGLVLMALGVTPQFASGAAFLPGGGTFRGQGYVDCRDGGCVWNILGRLQGRMQAGGNTWTVGNATGGGAISLGYASLSWTVPTESGTKLVRCLGLPWGDLPGDSDHPVKQWIVEMTCTTKSGSASVHPFKMFMELLRHGDPEPQYEGDPFPYWHIDGFFQTSPVNFR